MAKQIADDPTTEETDVTSSDEPRVVSRRAAPQTSSWAMKLTFGVALIAVALAAWALLKPAPEPADAEAATASAEQIASAKTQACAAFGVVRSAVSMQTHASGDGPAGIQAVAANARLAMLGGGAYLLSRTDPATPAELAGAIRDFANGLEDIAMHSLTGIGNEDPAQADRLRNADAANTKIAGLCGTP